MAKQAPKDQLSTSHKEKGIPQSRVLVGTPYPDEISVTIDEKPQSQTSRLHSAKAIIIVVLCVVFSSVFVSVSAYALQQNETGIIADVLDLVKGFFYAIMLWLGLKAGGK